MKIKRVHIENLGCIRSLDVAFDAVTSLIGPTGSGKSTVLRALDWFFNGEKGTSLGEEDVHSAAGTTRRIRVEVEFDGLTESDRAALGRYAPEGVDSFSVWRIWENGEDRITGKALAHPSFEKVRQGTGNGAKLNAYRELRESRPDLELPAMRGWDNAEAALRAWESSHRELLEEAEVDGTQFFGFAGQGLLNKLIDFVFVSADLRASEETDDTKSSTVGRILEHAVDRSEAEDLFSTIDQAAQAEREKVHTELYGPALATLSDALSTEVGRFTTGRRIVVTPVAQAPKRSRTTFSVAVHDGAAVTLIQRQGHGFQRALLIAALKHLSERRRPESGTRTLCLAIEEPELFQHPAQAKVFAQVLRDLVAADESQTQVMYATHSPAFINPNNYQQVRRLYRGPGADHPDIRLRELPEKELQRSLDGLVNAISVARRGSTRYAERLAEAMFADVAVLVEGAADEAILLGFAERQGLNLGADSICVVNVEGKGNMILCHAILTGLGVRCHLVFDADTGPAKDRKPEDVSANRALNLKIHRHLGVIPQPDPASASTETHTVFEDDLETYLDSEWPDWRARCHELIAENAGYVQGKHAPTYTEAARTAGGEPKLLHALVENVRGLLLRGAVHS